MRQKYSLEKITQALASYSVGQVQETKLFTIGIDNTNIYVKTDKLEGVLKIYEMYTAADLKYTEFELSIMAQVAECGLPVPQVIKTKKGNTVTAYQGKPIALISFLPGENIFRQPVSLPLIAKIGEASAKLDKCLQNFTPVGQERKKHYWNLKSFADGKKYLSYLDRDDKADHQLMCSIYEKYDKLIKPAFAKCQAGYIHNDIAAHNLLAKDDKLTAILDFGDAVKAYLIMEVAVSIAQLCLLQKDWQSTIQTFTKAYTDIVPLNKIEKNILYDLVKCRCANMVVYCNYLYHAEDKHPDFLEIHDQGVKNLAKLEEIGKDEFNKLIA